MNEIAPPPPPPPSKKGMVVGIKKNTENVANNNLEEQQIKDFNDKIGIAMNLYGINNPLIENMNQQLDELKQSISVKNQEQEFKEFKEKYKPLIL